MHEGDIGNGTRRHKRRHAIELGNLHPLYEVNGGCGIQKDDVREDVALIEHPRVASPKLAVENHLYEKTLLENRFEGRHVDVDVVVDGVIPSRKAERLQTLPFHREISAENYGILGPHVRRFCKMKWSRVRAYVRSYVVCWATESSCNLGRVGNSHSKSLTPFKRVKVAFP